MYAPEATQTTQQTASAAYRQLVARGLNPREAGNLTAYLHGIAIGDQPWAVREVSNLVFLRQLIGRAVRAERRRRYDLDCLEELRRRLGAQVPRASRGPQSTGWRGRQRPLTVWL